MRGRQYSVRATKSLIAIADSFPKTEIERITRRYAAELSEWFGPERDVPARQWHQRANHINLGDGHLRHAHLAQATTAVVTGKPHELGGSQGRTSEATEHGLVICCDKGHVQKLGMPRHGCRVIIQGFGNVSCRPPT